MNPTLDPVRKRRRFRGRSSVSQWFTDFGGYTIAQRPSDLRRAREPYGYDLVVRADAGVSSGKILKLEGAVGGSHVNTFRGLGTSANAARKREVRVKMRLSSVPTNSDGAGGVILSGYIDQSTWNPNDAQATSALGLYEIGMRVVGNGAGGTVITPWYYHHASALAGNFGTWGGATAARTAEIVVAGQWFHLAMKMDLDDTTAGANGTIWFKGWKDGTAEPAWGANSDGTAWFSSVANALPHSWAGLLGEPGIYANTPTYGAEYSEWAYGIGASAAPTSAASFAPTAIPSPLALLAADGFTNVVDFSGVTAGQEPSGWTREYEADSATAYTFLARADADGQGGIVARLDNPNGVDRRGFLYRTSLGAANGAQEIMVRMRFNQLVTSPVYHGGIGLRIEGAAGAGDSGIGITLQYDLSRYRLMAHKFVAGAFTASVMAGNLPGVSPNNWQAQWMWMRARIENVSGTHRLRAKAWLASESEPLDWFATGTVADAALASGGLGIYLYNNNVTIDYDVIGFKTA